jgi:hypothetical protein
MNFRKLSPLSHGAGESSDPDRRSDDGPCPCPRSDRDVPPDGEGEVYEWREGCHRIIERRTGPGDDVSAPALVCAAPCLALALPPPFCRSGRGRDHPQLLRAQQRAEVHEAPPGRLGERQESAPGRARRGRQDVRAQAAPRRRPQRRAQALVTTAFRRFLISPEGCTMCILAAYT